VEDPRHARPRGRAYESRAPPGHARILDQGVAYPEKGERDRAVVVDRRHHLLGLEHATRPKVKLDGERRESASEVEARGIAALRFDSVGSARAEG
jgi:hypothetical protein